MTHLDDFMKRLPTSYLVFLILVSLWCSLIVAAPLLRSATASHSTTSGFLYKVFGTVCHQIDERSFHVAGEKLGVCARCASLYFGFWLSLLLIPFAPRNRDQAVPPIAVLAVPLLFMGADVFLTIVGIHESTILTRTLTGGALGIVLPWFIVPPLIDAIDRVQDQIRVRRQRLQPGD